MALAQSCPAQVWPWLSLASQRTPGTLPGHFSLNTYRFFKSLWPCCATTELFLIVGLAASGVSSSAGQHLDILYCTMGFLQLLSKAQCYLFFVPMQSEVSSSPLTLAFMQQIPHKEKQRREWSSTGGYSKGAECPGGLLFNAIYSSVCLYPAFIPTGCFPQPLSPLPQQGWRPPLGQKIAMRQKIAKSIWESAKCQRKQTTNGRGFIKSNVTGQTCLLC